MVSLNHAVLVNSPKTLIPAHTQFLSAATGELAGTRLVIENGTMEQSEIEDRFRIHDLFARYMRAVDNWNEAELLGCFTEEGVLETPMLSGQFAGREGQLRFVAEGRKANRGRRSRHRFSNLEVEISGDRAHAQAYLLVTSTRDGETMIFASGNYDCLLKKVDGRWLFTSRKVFIDGKP